MGKKSLHDGRAGTLLAALLASSSALTSVFVVPAQARETQSPATPAANTAVRYDIDQQPLASALTEFARQSGVHVLYPYEALEHVNAQAVHGRFSRDEALRQLLANTGYNASFEGDVVRLEPPSRPQPLNTDAAAQAGAAPVGDDHAEPAQNGDTDAAAPDIVITGTRIRGAAPVGSHLLTLDRAAIDATGRTTLQDVIQTLPANFGGSQNEFTQEGTTDAKRNMSFASTIDLRGLGADATLTLLDGRRLAPAGAGNFVDISMIPLSAVKRVEILADGASAIYGSDAVGGVVNIILDENFKGAETRAHYGMTSDGGAGEWGASQLLGWNWGSGHLTAGYEYRHRDHLDMRDRDFLSTSDLRSRGGSNFSKAFANPGNITRIGTTSVSLAIPHGQDGTTLTESQLIANNPNFEELNEGSWFLPDQKSQSVFLSGRQSFSDRLEGFVDIVAGERDSFFLRENLTASLTVPETNAYRQLDHLFPGRGNLTVAYFMGDDLGPVRFATESHTYSAATGFTYALSSAWTLEASAALAHDREVMQTDNFFDSATIAPALASANLATAFNPFADGSNTNAAVLAGLTFSQHGVSDGLTRTYALKADGPLFELPAGAVRAAFGTERREESFSFDRSERHQAGIVTQITQAPGHRDVNAVFAELYLPLVSADQNVPLIHALSLSLSARREDASDYGASTTPKYGVSWEMVPGLSFRGTWGRSFKGPQFTQTLGAIALTNLTASPAQDPLATNGSTGVLIISGANRSLKPERAESWTAGFDLAPRWAPSLAFSATYFDIDFANRIASAANDPFGVLANPRGFESVFFRNPSPALLASYLALGPPPTGALPADGVEVIIDRRLVNLSSQRVRGVDVDARYAFDTSLGHVDAFANATNLLQFDSTLVAGAHAIDLLNTMNNPVDWRFRAGANWRAGDASAGLSLNYVNQYRDTRTVPERAIKSWTTLDLRLAYDFRGPEGGRGPQLALSVQNLFGRDPPFANNPAGWALDPANASALGRVLTLDLRQTW